MKKVILETVLQKHSSKNNFDICKIITNNLIYKWKDIFSHKFKKFILFQYTSWTSDKDDTKQQD